MEPTRTPGRLGNSVPKAGSVYPGAWHLGVRSRGVVGSPRRQTNWAKNPWAAPEGGRQREQSSHSSLHGEREAVGGVGSLGLEAAGKSCDSSDSHPGWWSRSKLAGDDKFQFSQKPKG